MKKILKALVPSKTPTEPGLGERYGAALALHGAATSVFKAAHDDLVQAEAELSAIGQDAGEQIRQAQAAHDAAVERMEDDLRLKVNDLSAIADMAYDDAYMAYERAEKIRPLVA
ncbi:hypothetical protein [Kribbella sindirgiensis]|uniref:Uncharacterized protein n=1 Tax=Kribbella sindirgiensis TaxID=1124744 RepID=A0A4R0I277_9ACTN|nr:hypothetical protein [Kribbella sindirgiensis]TCC19976.1 hypothetical protein E0H50_37770 [Kribbella sindirgiensis]